ncbi:hypothetical protein GCM10022197_35490 [Microlunatus spumicola]|uniref:Uncharacterized protein n=1 Tax=Microlunatus spumicola TaxID=81499 RepID=A0ABP6Y279_9ACTN
MRHPLEVPDEETPTPDRSKKSGAVGSQRFLRWGRGVGYELPSFTSTLWAGAPPRTYVTVTVVPGAK